MGVGALGAGRGGGIIGVRELEGVVVVDSMTRVGPFGEGVTLYGSEDEVRAEAARARKMICRLYSGTTPVGQILGLLHDLQIGMENDLRRTRERLQGGASWPTC
jgi:hypothetical protein